MSKEMPDKIWVEHNTTGPTGIVGGAWNSEPLDEYDTSYTRTDTISAPSKITIIRQRPDGYWEMLSDGSDIFRGYDESIEEDYMDEHPEHNDVVEEAWIQCPAGQWQGIHPDCNLEDEVEDLEKAGYQVFVIPTAPSKTDESQP